MRKYMIIIFIIITAFIMINSNEIEAINKVEAEKLLLETDVLEENINKNNSSKFHNEHKKERGGLSFFLSQESSEGFFLIRKNWKERISFYKFIETVRYDQKVKIWEMSQTKNYIYVLVRTKWYVILYQKPEHKSGLFFEF